MYVGSASGIMTWLLAGGSKVHLLADGKKLLPSPKSAAGSGTPKVS